MFESPRRHHSKFLISFGFESITRRACAYLAGAAIKSLPTSPGCLVVVGSDGTPPDRDWGGNQLVVSFSPDEPVGWARKVFASDRDTNGDGRHPYLLFEDDFGDPNRFVTLANGEVACLNACYVAVAFSELATGPTRKRRGLR